MQNNDVFINASTLRVGGGKSVAKNILSILSADYKGTFFHVVAPNHQDYINIKAENIKVTFVPAFFHNPIFRLLLDKWVLKILKSSKCETVLNLGNIGLPSKKYKQFTLFHFPYAIYPKSQIWNILGFKDSIRFKLMVYLFKKRIKFTNHFFAQTKTSKNRLIKYFGILENMISILPNAVSVDNFSSKLIPNEIIDEKIPIDKNYFNCLCLSVYYPHKNIESLVKVGRLIKEKGYQIRIFLTLEENESKMVGLILNEIKTNNLENIIVNLGRVNMDNISYLYSKVDSLLLPTILESFSGTYVESMYFRKKIITSDFDFAKEICLFNTHFFDPFSEDDILEKILLSWKNHSDKEEALAFNSVLNMPTWKETTKELMNTIAKDG